MQRPMESLRHKGSSGVPIWLEICVKSLKVLQLQGFPFVCQKTPTLKAAGSNPVRHAKKKRQFPIGDCRFFLFFSLFSSRFSLFSKNAAFRIKDKKERRICFVRYDYEPDLFSISSQMLFCAAIVVSVSPNCERIAPKRVSSLALKLHANALAIAVIDTVSSHGVTAAPAFNYILLNWYIN